MTLWREKMTRDEMTQGFARGRTLIQEEWSHPDEIKWADELVAEGRASTTTWEYNDNFQCKRRKIKGIKEPQ